jgi:tryptophan synthase beta chain
VWVFYEYLQDENVALIGVEAGGRGTALGEHAARFAKNGGGVPGVLQGTYSYVLQNEAGQVASTHSVSAGLDYASVGPEHAMLHDCGRATYTSATDDEALDGVRVLSRTEGIIPALETAHAVAEAIKMAPKMRKDQIIMVNVSGRGDKDIGIMTREMNLTGTEAKG